MCSKKISIILVADSDGSNFTAIKNALSSSLLVVRASGVEDAFKKVLKFDPDFLVADICLKDSNGFELIKKVRRVKKYKPKIIILSKLGNPKIKNDTNFLSTLGISLFLVKSTHSVNKIISLISKEVNFY